MSADCDIYVFELPTFEIALYVLRQNLHLCRLIGMRRFEGGGIFANITAYGDHLSNEMTHGTDFLEWRYS